MSTPTTPFNGVIIDWPSATTGGVCTSDGKLPTYAATYEFFPGGERVNTQVTNLNCIGPNLGVDIDGNNTIVNSSPFLTQLPTNLPSSLTSSNGNASYTYISKTCTPDPVNQPSMSTAQVTTCTWQNNKPICKTSNVACEFDIFEGTPGGPSLTWPYTNIVGPININSANPEFYLTYSRPYNY